MFEYVCIRVCMEYLSGGDQADPTQIGSNSGPMHLEDQFKLFDKVTL